MQQKKIVTVEESEPCKRCGAGTQNRVAEYEDPLCDPCLEEFRFWSEVFGEVAE